EALSVAAHCWREQAASLCLDANWSANQLDANARLRDLPLAMLNTPSAAQQAAEFPPALIPRLPSGTTVDGSLTADVRVSGDTGAPAGLALRFSVDAESGSITITPPDAAQEQGDDAEDRTDSIQR